MEGTVINTITCTTGYKVSRQHNLRNRKITKNQKHIKSYKDNDPKEVKEQIEKLHETWLDIEPHKAYEELFGEAIKEYNDNQKRADRKIKDYYNHINNGGNKEKKAYEMLVGVYKSQYVKGDNGDRIQLIQSEEENARNKIILKEFYEKFVSENKNLKIIGCYFHEDEEGAPHLHIDYIPYAHYEKGLKLRTSMSKAIEEMNKEQHFVKEGKNPYGCWDNKNRQMLDDICSKYGIKVSYPTREKKEVATKLSVREYKQKEIEKMEHITNRNQILINEQEVKKTKNRKIINDQCETYYKNKENIDKNLTHKNNELKDINEQINQKTITNQKYKTAIERQVEIYNANQKTLKNRISEISNPTDKEIFEFFKLNKKEIYEEITDYLKEQKEEELEKELPDIDNDF